MQFLLSIFLFIPITILCIWRIVHHIKNIKHIVILKENEVYEYKEKATATDSRTYNDNVLTKIIGEKALSMKHNRRIINQIMLCILYFSIIMIMIEWLYV